MLIVIIKGKVEIGFEIPRGGYNIFIKKPVNIKKAMLNPTEYRIISIVLSLFDLSIWRINNPGMRVRKRNPNICLKNGMFKRMAKSVRITIETTNANHSLCLNFNTISTP